MPDAPGHVAGRGAGFDISFYIVYKFVCMSADEYRAALGAAIKEYEALGEQRRGIDSRLSHLAQTIGTLNRLLGLTPTVPLGLTDACRLVLRSGLPMTPVAVRDRLLAIGVDLSGYSNELSAIHTVLKRLNESGELRLVPGSGGKAAYLWQLPTRAVAIGPEVADYLRQSGRTHDVTPAPRKRRKSK
jgi:hypothetical protein